MRSGPTLPSADFHPRFIPPCDGITCPRPSIATPVLRVPPFAAHRQAVAAVPVRCLGLWIPVARGVPVVLDCRSAKMRLGSPGVLLTAFVTRSSDLRNSAMFTERGLRLVLQTRPYRPRCRLISADAPAFAAASTLFARPMTLPPASFSGRSRGDTLPLATLRLRSAGNGLKLLYFRSSCTTSIFTN